MGFCEQQYCYLCTTLRFVRESCLPACFWVKLERKENRTRKKNENKASVARCPGQHGDPKDKRLVYELIKCVLTPQVLFYLWVCHYKEVVNIPRDKETVSAGSVQRIVNTNIENRYLAMKNMCECVCTRVCVWYIYIVK